MKFIYGCPHCRKGFFIESKEPSYLGNHKCYVCGSELVFLCSDEEWKSKRDEEKEILFDKISGAPNFDSINLAKIERHLRFLKNCAVAYIVLSVVAALIIIINIL